MSAVDDLPPGFAPPPSVWSCCGTAHPGPHLDACPEAPAASDASPTPPDVPWLAGGQRMAIVRNLDRAVTAVGQDKPALAGAVAAIAQAQATVALVDQLDRLARILQVRP